MKRNTEALSGLFSIEKNSANKKEFILLFFDTFFYKYIVGLGNYST